MPWPTRAGVLKELGGLGDSTAPTCTTGAAQGWAFPVYLPLCQPYGISDRSRLPAGAEDSGLLRLPDLRRLGHGKPAGVCGAGVTAPRPLKPVDRSGPAQGLRQPPGPGAAPPLGLCFPGTLDGPHNSPSAPHPGLSGGPVRLQANRRAPGSLAPRAGVGLLGVNAGRGPGCQRPAEAGRPGWPGGGEAGPQREAASRRH